MKHIREMITNITRILDMMKGFSTGSSSSDSSHIIVWHEDKAYKVTFEEVENDINNPFNVINRELN